MEDEYVEVINENVNRICEHQALSDSDKLKAIFNVFTTLTEEITENQRIVFTTLFSRVAFIGNKFNIKSQDLHHLHLYRRANEKLDFKLDKRLYILLGTYSIRLLLHYTFQANKPELTSDVSEKFASQTEAIVGFKPVIDGLIVGMDVVNYVLEFIDELDGATIHKVQFDVADKNEIFTQNIDSINKHLLLPLHANLIDVELMEDGRLVPQGLVIMPDYLMDVTSIAECFKDYGTEVFLSAISRFKKMDPLSIPLLIGNIANLFLDELVADPDVKFAKLVPLIFKYNPIAMSLYSDDDIREIVAKAKIHYENLKRAIKEETKALGFVRDNIYLEPSFYSRDYGMQGRLDMFHHDERRNKYDIVELKSGSPYKANIYGLSNNHYVQTLLYDLLVKSTFGKRVKPASYILYSKLGDRSLKYSPSAKGQQHDAMRVRNELLVMEYISAYDIEKYRSLLHFIKLDHFPKVRGFLQSDVDGFHKLLLSKPKYMQDYLIEFTAFIKREQFLSKTGVHGLENSNGLAAIWLENSEEKEDRFAILKKLEILKNNSEDEVPTLTLTHGSSTSPLANFREGDIAVLYPYNNAPRSVMHNQVFKCGILSRTKDSVTVKLRSKQYNHGLFRKYKYWNIEEDKLDSSFTKAYRAIFKFFSAKAEKQMLLTGQQPSRMASEEIDIPRYEMLTGEQYELLKEMVISQDYYLLWGPPGTGKTSVMLKSYVKYLIEHTDQNLLLMAYTNRAVDEICGAVTSIAADYEEMFIRIGSSTASGAAYRPRILDNYISTAKNRVDILDKMKSIRIVIGTISSMINKPEIFKLLKFQTAVIDEASQILEPNIVGILTEVDKFILIGDHKQLPAVVQQDKSTCEVVSTELRDIGITDMSMSLFERLFSQCLSNGWEYAYGLLSHQGRMHEELVRFPSNQFYEGKLKILNGINRLNAPIWEKVNDVDGIPKERLNFISTQVSDSLNYKTNEYEAEAVVTLLERYVARYIEMESILTPLDIGVITPYRAQIALIKKLCDEREVDVSNITIDTVERFQGGARDLIIISLCVNKVRQFRSLVSLSTDGVDRKLNVALTRAKEQIVLIGNEDLLSKNVTYLALIENSNEFQL